MTDLETRPSERSRWAECSGYPAFKTLLASEERLPPEERSEFAARGTVGHWLVEALLRRLAGSVNLAWDPSDLVRQLHKQVGNTIEQDGFRVEVTQELADAAVECVLSVCNLICQHGLPVTVLVEEPVASGTPDVVLWFPVLRLLIVVDHKFGAGVAVEPRGNKQLQQYAVEAYDALGEDVEQVWLVINQPFNGGVKESKHDVAEIHQWAEDLRKEQFRVNNPQRRLAAGSWCRWCPCELLCPAKDKMVEEAVAFAKMPAKLPTLSEDALGARLRQFEDLLVPYGHALRTQLHNGLERGEYDSAAAGWKLVDKRATRRWKDETRASITLEQECGFLECDIYKRTLLSPAQIEKLAKKLGVVLPDIGDQVESISSGTTLARVADKRPAKPRLVALGEFPGGVT